MNGLKPFLTEKYVKLKTWRVFKEIDKTPMAIPMPANTVRNVMIVLPRQVEYVDSAVALIRKLRRHFSRWNYMVLDLDKVLAHKLNRLNLPNRNFLQELEKNTFDLVINLNFEFDIRTAYLVVMLKIPYRVNLFPGYGNFYNVVIQPRSNDSKNFDFVLEYLQTIFQK